MLAMVTVAYRNSIYKISIYVCILFLGMWMCKAWMDEKRFLEIIRVLNVKREGQDFWAH